MESVIIIGAGVAGLAAACETAKQGKACVLVSLQYSERAQSVLADGGALSLRRMAGHRGANAVYAQNSTGKAIMTAELQTVSTILANGLSIIRTEKNITRAMKLLSEIRPPDHHCDVLLLGTAMLRSALERRESRGAHFREDYPQADDTYRMTTAAAFDGNDIHIDFRDISVEMEEC